MRKHRRALGGEAVDEVVRAGVSQGSSELGFVGAGIIKLHLVICAAIARTVREIHCGWKRPSRSWSPALSLTLAPSHASEI